MKSLRLFPSPSPDTHARTHAYTRTCRDKLIVTATRARSIFRVTAPLWHSVRDRASMLFDRLSAIGSNRSTIRLHPSASLRFENSHNESHVVKFSSSQSFVINAHFYAASLESRSTHQSSQFPRIGLSLCNWISMRGINRAPRKQAFR